MNRRETIVGNIPLGLVIPQSVLLRVDDVIE